LFIQSVLSIEGDIALTEYKEDHKTKLKKTTMKDKLGAFMVTRDSAQVKTKKERSNGESKGQETSLEKRKTEGPPTVGQTKENGYIMLALDGQDEVPCHSCGYPTMTALAPESLTRFDRKYTCSTSCFRSLAHYKSANSKVLETKTVKRATDSLHAATAFAVKALRRTNAEEGGSGEMDGNCMSVAMSNQAHIMKMCNIGTSYIWNASHQVADGCNRRLYDAKTYAGLARGIPTMGQVQPSLIGRKGTEWCTSLMKKTKREKVNLDVTKHVQWPTIAAEMEKGREVQWTTVAAEMEKGTVNNGPQQDQREGTQLQRENVQEHQAATQLQREKVNLGVTKKMQQRVKIGLEEHWSALQFQRVWRSFYVRQKLAKLAATKLQREKVKLGVKHRAALQLQSVWRSYRAVDHFRYTLICIKRVQNRFRQKKASKDVEQQRTLRKDHGATSNPKTPVGGTKHDLADTPEHAPAARGKKKLRQGKRNLEKDKTKEIAFDRVVWTKEELNEEEYGIPRFRLKQHGVEKAHVENMKRVMSDDYPELVDVMSILLKSERTAEEVANTISGVPTRRSSLEEKLRDLVGPPDVFPDECEYILLGKKQATCRSAEVIERSERLYQKKMSDAGDNKEMMLIECGIHDQTEVKMLMKISKSGRSSKNGCYLTKLKVCVTHLKEFPSWRSSTNYTPQPIKFHHCL
jgi:hypothetical protein